MPALLKNTWKYSGNCFECKTSCYVELNITRSLNIVSVSKKSVFSSIGILLIYVADRHVAYIFRNFEITSVNSGSTTPEAA
jgi:hypothetical protein